MTHEQAEAAIEAIRAGVRPLRREPIRAHEMDDEAVLYDLAHNAVHYLNLTAYHIWQCCDGQHTTSEIADLLARRFDLLHDPAANLENMLRDVNATLAELAGNGLIDLKAEVP